MFLDRLIKVTEIKQSHNAVKHTRKDISIHFILFYFIFYFILYCLLIINMICIL